jgi:hypothetical protein
MPTVKTAFGRGVPLVNLDQGPPIPGRFVLQLPDELTPTHVRDSLCQAMVFDHVLDLQTLDTDDLVFAYDVGRELVLRVSPSIGNLLMDASNLQTSFCTVLGTFFLLRVTALSFCQLLLILSEELGVAGGLPLRGDDHRLQAQVEPDHLGRDFQWLDVLFHQDGDKIAFGFILSDGDTPWLAPIRQGAMPCDAKRGLHLSQSQGMPIPGERIARIGSSLLVPLLFEGGILRTPFKEVAKSFIKMSKSLLERNRRNFIQPNRLFLLFEHYQTLRSPFIVQALAMLVVRICALSQCPVIDVAATSEGLCQETLLFIARIEAILVSFLLFHALQYSMYAVKCQTVSQPITPQKGGPSIPRLKD